MNRRKGAIVGAIAVLLIGMLFIIGKEKIKQSPADLQGQSADKNVQEAISSGDNKGSETDGDSQTEINSKPNGLENVQTSVDETANWKTYSNSRYGYTIKYPESWYIKTDSSEKDFSKRGGDGTTVSYIGGDTTWSNYPEFDYMPGDEPSDWRTVSVMIFKTDESLDNFINEYNSPTAKISDKTVYTIQGKDVIEYSISDDEGGMGEPAAQAYVKLDSDSIMAFGAAKDDSKILNLMVSSLKFTK